LLADLRHTWKKIRDWLLNEFGIEASVSLVFRELKKMQRSCKVANKKAAVQSDALRRVFQATLQQNHTADHLVAIDESACNERIGDRKYGWGPIGRSVELEYSLKRSKRWSLLPAMTVDGNLANHVLQGVITADFMVVFLQQDVLLQAIMYF
jgi:hypothetical protein